MMVAVTDRDEVNLLACMPAKHAGVGSTVARLPDRDLRGPAGRPVREATGVDLVRDPYDQTAGPIHHLLGYRGASVLTQRAGAWGRRACAPTGRARVPGSAAGVAWACLARPIATPGRHGSPRGVRRRWRSRMRHRISPRSARSSVPSPSACVAASTRGRTTQRPIVFEPWPTE